MLWFMHGELHLETVHEYKLYISTVYLIYGQIFKLKRAKINRKIMESKYPGNMHILAKVY